MTLTPSPHTQQEGKCTDLRAAVGLAVDNLWRGVERAAAERVQQLVLAVDVRQTEVGDLATAQTHNSVTTLRDTNTHNSVTTPPDTNTHTHTQLSDDHTGHKHT